MIVHNLYYGPYYAYGQRYNSVNWRNEWYTFLKLAEKEREEYEFNSSFLQSYNSINHILYWFDANVIQSIDKVSKTTLNVRIRIICGMINKMQNKKITREIKIELMECIWDAYNKLYRQYFDWYCLNILQLPF